MRGGGYFFIVVYSGKFKKRAGACSELARSAPSKTFLRPFLLHPSSSEQTHHIKRSIPLLSPRKNGCKFVPLSPFFIQGKVSVSGPCVLPQILKIALLLYFCSIFRRGSTAPARPLLCSCTEFLHFRRGSTAPARPLRSSWH